VLRGVGVPRGEGVPPGCGVSVGVATGDGVPVPVGVEEPLVGVEELPTVAVARGPGPAFEVAVAPAGGVGRVPGAPAPRSVVSVPCWLLALCWPACGNRLAPATSSPTAAANARAPTSRRRSATPCSLSVRLARRRTCRALGSVRRLRRQSAGADR
jgi:hypothetical protein